MEFLINLINNILANIIFFALGGTLILALIQKEMRRKNVFFGTTSNKKIHVYLSSVSLRDVDAITHFDEKERFTGNALFENEFRIIPEISSLFPHRFPTEKTLSNVAEAFSSLVDSYMIIQKPEIIFMPSPRIPQNANFPSTSKSTIICVGSMIYNSVSYYYQQAEQPVLQVLKDSRNCEIRLVQQRATKQVFYRDLEDKKNDLGVVLKIHDQNENVVFIAAGLGVNATCAAVVYLTREWKSLHKRFPNSDFGVLIECDHISENVDGYRSPSFLFDLKGKDIDSRVSR
jgi:hypothetical protein